MHVCVCARVRACVCVCACISVYEDIVRVWRRVGLVSDLTLQTLSKGGEGFLLRHKLDSVHDTFLRKAGYREGKESGSMYVCNR